MKKTFTCSRFNEFLEDCVTIVDESGRILWSTMISKAQKIQVATHGSKLDIAGKHSQIVEHLSETDLIEALVDKDPEPIYVQHNVVYKYRFCTFGVYVEDEESL